MKFQLLGLWVFAVACGTVEAGNLQRESDYASNLQQTTGMGRGIWLTSGGQRFFALFTEAEKTDNSQAVIVLHDMGEHPDQRPVIHGLRAVLPQHNWTTLSIQLPLRESGASQEDYYGLFDEAHGRIQASVDYLRNQGAKNIAVVGYGVGAAMAAYALSLDPKGLTALAAISLPLPESTLPQAQIGQFIKNIALPFLDVYAEFDLPDVVDTARQRRMLGKDNPVFRQIRINGENHTYQHDPVMLIKRIYSWLALSVGPN